MAKYLFLYSGGNQPESEADHAKMMDEWRAWLTGLGSALSDPGNPIGPEKKVTDGEVSDESAGRSFNGYSIAVADSLEQAVKIAQGCPGLPDGLAVSVFEIFPVMS